MISLKFSKYFFSSVFTVYSYSLYVKNYETPKNYFPWTFLEKAKCNERNNCIMFKDWRTLWKMVRYRMCSGILDSLSLPPPVYILAKTSLDCSADWSMFSRLTHVQQIDPCSEDWPMFSRLTHPTSQNKPIQLYNLKFSSHIWHFNFCFQDRIFWFWFQLQLWH